MFSEKITNYLKPFTREELEQFKKDFGEDNFLLLTDLYGVQFQALNKKLYFDVGLKTKTISKRSVLVLEARVAHNSIFSVIPFLYQSETFQLVPREESDYSSLLKKIKSKFSNEPLKY